jgi:hypothetical protein
MQEEQLTHFDSAEELRSKLRVLVTAFYLGDAKQSITAKTELTSMGANLDEVDRPSNTLSQIVEIIANQIEKMEKTNE